jgi:hypothetical protein
MPCLRWLVAFLSSQKLGFVLGSVHVGFVVDKTALGQVFLRVLWLAPVNIFPSGLSMLIYHLEDEQKAHWWLQSRDILSPHPHEHHHINNLRKKLPSALVSENDTLQMAS